MEYHWTKQDSNGVQWSPMESDGVQWIPMDSNGVRWSLMESTVPRIHINYAILQPFAKRLAVPGLRDFENKQNKIDPNVGFGLFPRLIYRIPYHGL
jgi:hypothetical protein